MLELTLSSKLNPSFVKRESFEIHHHERQKGQLQEVDAFDQQQDVSGAAVIVLACILPPSPHVAGGTRVRVWIRASFDCVSRVSIMTYAASVPYTPGFQ